MRALQGELGGFSFAVSEFVRVSIQALPTKVFRRDIPELRNGGMTPTGLPVQIQILGGDPERMAISAQRAHDAGAQAIDINFGCPAPTVNRNDGGASLLRHPDRIYDIVKAVREALPAEVPVSAKLRLGWDSIDSIYENAERAASAGASWITIHARTRVQGYAPPVHWRAIGEVRQQLNLPIVANGDIWTIDDFRRCQDVTGCSHFMIGRGALANPRLAHGIAHELGLRETPPVAEVDWIRLMRGLMRWTEFYENTKPNFLVRRMKQWLSLASSHGDFPFFHELKWCDNLDEFMGKLEGLTAGRLVALGR